MKLAQAIAEVRAFKSAELIRFAAGSLDCKTHGPPIAHALAAYAPAAQLAAVCSRAATRLTLDLARRALVDTLTQAFCDHAARGGT